MEQELARHANSNATLIRRKQKDPLRAPKQDDIGKAKQSTRSHSQTLSSQSKNLSQPPRPQRSKLPRPSLVELRGPTRVPNVPSTHPSSVSVRPIFFLNLHSTLLTQRSLADNLSGNPSQTNPQNSSKMRFRTAASLRALVNSRSTFSRSAMGIGLVSPARRGVNLPRSSVRVCSSSCTTWRRSCVVTVD